MIEHDIPQAEADRLHAIDKRRADNEVWALPGLGGEVSIPLISHDGRENFHLDVRRGRINLAKGTNQNRWSRVVILARLDYAGPPHRNPDGTHVGGNHLHLYREGFGDKWAIDAPKNIFSDLTNHILTLEEFMNYCNVSQHPDIQLGI